MGRILYFDCIAGIAGDMALGALIDAGAELDEIRAALGALPLEPFELGVEEVETYGLRALRAVVETPVTGMIRTYASIRSMLEEAELPEEARRIAQRVFRRLAEAEARIHRRELETVTFHEVGAVDSIIDITGTAIALCLLGVERVFASPVPTGMGMTKSEHGAMPIPAPAVVELLRGAPLYSKGVTQELVTPTGAAILAALAEGFGELPMMRVGAVGYGAGTHRLGFPNVLRVLIGEEEPRAGAIVAAGTPEVVLQTNIDDLNPELYSYVLERLFAAGAQDAWLTPIVMKKGRPAITVSVLASPELEDRLRRILFAETGTLGVRSAPVAKHALDRQSLKVETSNGVVAVKVGLLEGHAVTVAPEFEDCARLARESGTPAKEIYDEAARRAREQLGERGEPG